MSTLKQLKNIMNNGDLPAMAFHFSEYINNKFPDDSVALAAALLSWKNTEGHVCIELNEYANQVIQFNHDEDSSITAPPLINWLAALQTHPWVTNGFPSPLILEGSRLYLGKYWKFESQLTSAITKRFLNETKTDLPILKSGLERLFPKLDIEVDWQSVAAATALLNRFAIISGGPGTGKTSTVIRILALLLAQNPDMKIELVAPTGKAAARLAESIRKGKQDPRLSALTKHEKLLIPESAKTIHRLLKYSPRGFQHNPHNLIPVDTLVIDEASMVDLPLMARLLEATPSNAQIILLGDRDQLSSVEAGSVLGDITGHGQDIQYNKDFIQQLEEVGAIKTGDIKAANALAPPISRCISLLYKSYRFDDNSGIGVTAKLINSNNGKQALMDVLFNDNYPDANWLDSGDERINPKCIKWAVNHYRHYLQQINVKDALRAFETIRVLTALRAGSFGMRVLNDLIINELVRLNEINYADEFHGKPIMITQNDYELDLFNGDIGLIWQDDDQQQLNAYFPAINGEVRRIPTHQLPQHETAFAMTIHKSQGSEFDNLLLLLPPKLNPVLTKELIYTGITRAKKQVLVAGNEAVFIKACNKTIQRSSGLAEKLGW